MNIKHILFMLGGALVAWNISVAMGPGGTSDPALGIPTPTTLQAGGVTGYLALAAGAYAGWWIAKRYA